MSKLVMLQPECRLAGGDVDAELTTDLPSRGDNIAVSAMTAANAAQPFEWDPSHCPLRSAHLADSASLLSKSEELSQAGEEYRIIRTKILQLLEKPFRLAISSPSVGDGKTITATNLAVACALNGDDRTLLIDGDLRRPSIHVRLQVPNEPGLADVLTGRCSLQEAIFEVQELRGLYVLPAGQADANISELLDSASWHGLGPVLSKQFAHIVVDCPPVDLFADYDLIGAVCDAVLLVVRPDRTDRNLFAAALAKLPPKLLGVVVNAAEDSFLNPRSSRRYHEYYRYAHEDRLHRKS